MALHIEGITLDTKRLQTRACKIGEIFGSLILVVEEKLSAQFLGGKSANELQHSL